MFYFLSLSVGMIVGYALFRRSAVKKHHHHTSSHHSHPTVKFIGKRSAVVDIGKGVKLFVPVCIVDKKFSGRIRLSLLNGGETSASGTAMPISSKIIEYPASETEICLFPPFTIQNKIVSSLAVELLDEISSAATTPTPVETVIVSNEQRNVNLFPLGWWYPTIEELIKNHK